MSSYRIPISNIRRTETTPRAKGGQGSIIVANLIPADGSVVSRSEQVVAVKIFEFDREDAKESTKFFKVFIGSSYLSFPVIDINALPSLS